MKKHTENTKDPILEKVLAFSKEHIEPLISEEGKEWFRQYNEIQHKKIKGLSSLLQELQELQEPETRSFSEIIRGLIGIPSKLELTPTYAYGSNEEQKLTVKIEPVPKEDQHVYHLKLNAEVKFSCSLSEESYLFIMQENIEDRSCKFIAPDQDSVGEIFQTKDFEKLPAMTNPYNMFNYAFEEKGHFYWFVVALPNLPWGEDPIEREELILELKEILKPKDEEKPPIVALEFSIS